MIDAKALPELKKHIATLTNQLSLFETKVKDAPEIEPGEKGPEEERARILSILASYQEKLPKIEKDASGPLFKNGTDSIDIPTALLSLEFIDTTLKGLKQDAEIISEDQYECKLEIYKQEILKTVELILSTFDYVLPNIRFELKFMEKYYREPANMGKTVMPELNDLVHNLEEHHITLDEFFKGYKAGENKTPGYNVLRMKNGLFSKYQFFDNSPDAYKELNDIYYQICKFMEFFLKDKRSEPELGKFYFQVKEMSMQMSRMSDVFDTGAFLTSLIRKSKKKYSYVDEVRKSSALLQKFNELKKSLIVYNEQELKRAQSALESKFSQEGEKGRLKAIVDETWSCIKEKQIDFSRLDMIFSKLLKKNFNIVVREKDAEDITITITPHHERKYGRDILSRINIIIQEIDFWYPPNEKQLLFQNIAITTEKIQTDKPLDKKEFMTMMQGYDQNMEKNIRKTYPDKVKELANIYSAFNKLFPGKAHKVKLEKRLMNDSIWEEISEDIELVKRNIAVLSSNNASMKKNVNKFPFLRVAIEHLSQVLYDLSMQLYISFEGIDGRSVTNMTNILSTYNEFRDIPSLWAAFSHYYSKTSMQNLSVNEKVMIELTKDPRCQTCLKEMFNKND
jgi:hypothetical protein